MLLGVNRKGGFIGSHQAEILSELGYVTLLAVPKVSYAEPERVQRCRVRESVAARCYLQGVSGGTAQ
jgi:hypothetical protein